MVRKSKYRLISALLCATVSCGAHALEFSLCTEDQAVPPLTSLNENAPGTGELLLRLSAEKSGAVIHHVQAPWHQCQAMLRSDKVQALNVAGYAAININIAKFPMRGAQPDERKSVGVVRTLLYRRVGSDVDLQGDHFIHLKTPVGVIHRYQVNSLSVARLGGIVDDNSRTVQSLAQRLAGGRLDLVAAGDAMRDVVATHYAGKIEALSTPLDETHYYLAFSLTFYAAHSKEVEQFWQQMAEIKQSREYALRIAPKHGVPP